MTNFKDKSEHGVEILDNLPLTKIKNLWLSLPVEPSESDIAIVASELISAIDRIYKGRWKDHSRRSEVEDHLQTWQRRLPRLNFDPQLESHHSSLEALVLGGYAFLLFWILRGIRGALVDPNMDKSDKIRFVSVAETAIAAFTSLLFRENRWDQELTSHLSTAINLLTATPFPRPLNLLRGADLMNLNDGLLDLVKALLRRGDMTELIDALIEGKHARLQGQRDLNHLSVMAALSTDAIWAGLVRRRLEQITNRQIPLILVATSEYPENNFAPDPDADSSPSSVLIVTDLIATGGTMEQVGFLAKRYLESLPSNS